MFFSFDALRCERFVARRSIYTLHCSKNAASQKFNIYFFVMPANTPVVITRFSAEVL